MLSRVSRIAGCALTGTAVHEQWTRVVTPVVYSPALLPDTFSLWQHKPAEQPRVFGIRPLDVRFDKIQEKIA
jgi:hypothetical protein